MNEQQGLPSGQTSCISPLDGPLAKSLRLALAIAAEPAMSGGHPTFGREGTVAPFQFQGKRKSAEGVDAGRILLLRYSSPE